MTFSQKSEKIFSIYRDKKLAQVRFEKICAEFETEFGFAPTNFFSSPGRTEICGNHTDHNCGKILGAPIDRDTIACVAKWNKNQICIKDLSYGEKIVFSLESGETPKSRSGALLFQICKEFECQNVRLGGFCAVFETEVLSSSGLSSSASFEMLFGKIISVLFNGGEIPTIQLALAGQKAEHLAWQKSVGLLDQLSCAVGGTIQVDFENPASPKIEKIPFDFNSSGYDLLLVSTGKGHANLSAKYSAIPAEMRDAARFFGKNNLREVQFDDLLKNSSEIRAKCGDRALLRAYHFFTENLRVERASLALKNSDFDGFLQVVAQSGLSSWRFLQNVAADEKSQEICVFLAATEIFAELNNVKIASRVHGGGFAGVVQVFCPCEWTEEYRSFVGESLNAPNSVLKTQIRSDGLCGF